MGQPVETHWTRDLTQLGAGVDPQASGLGMATRFDNGLIVVRYSGAVISVWGQAFARYYSLVHQRTESGMDPPGLPEADIQPATRGWLVQRFEGCEVYWLPMPLAPDASYAGLLPAHSPIRDRWLALGGGDGIQGYPLGSQSALANGAPELESELAYGSRFEHGFILWHARLGTFFFNAPMFAAWPPVFTEVPASDLPLLVRLTGDTAPGANGGFYNLVDGGGIFLAPGSVGAHLVHGAIYEKWQSLGREGGFLGYPTTSESPAQADGRFNRFQHGSIYWDRARTFESHGPIHDYWASLVPPFERSRFGYPTSDVTAPMPGVQRQTFQHGTLEWRSGIGVREVTMTVPGPRTPMAPAAGSYGGFLFYNCDPEGHTMHVWIADSTEGPELRDIADVASESRKGEPCGPGATSAYTYTFQDSHRYRLAIVDPDRCGGKNDPQVLACLWLPESGIFLGDSQRGRFVLQSNGLGSL
jgi:hypothetical protein